VTRVVSGSPARVYGVLADYHEHHAKILPKRYVTGLVVEEGGVGAGTVYRTEMSAAGRTRSFRAIVSEPEPGRVLVETYPDSGTVTSFTVDPGPGEGTSKVTIETEWIARGGLLGMLERTLTAGYLRRVFEQELKLLDEYARA